VQELLTDISKNSDLVLSSDEVDESAVIEYITERVASLLDRSPELLFSWMYRLDVLEHKIQSVLRSPGNVPVDQALAQLIWERQKQRYATKKKYSQQTREK